MKEYNVFEGGKFLLCNTLVINDMMMADQFVYLT